MYKIRTQRIKNNVTVIPGFKPDETIIHEDLPWTCDGASNKPRYASSVGALAMSFVLSGLSAREAAARSGTGVTTIYNWLNTRPDLVAAGKILIEQAKVYENV